MRPLLALLLLPALLLGLLAPSTAVAQDPTAQDPTAQDPTALADADCLADVGGVDLQEVDVAGLQAAMDAGTLSSQALVRASLARIRAYDPALNAIRELDPDAMREARALDAERARSGARGPLHGIPVLLKDNVGTADLPTTAGSVALEGLIPPDDAVITAALRDAGAIVLGKANLSEFANWVDLRMPNGYSSLGGQVVSPHAVDQDPLGSSTGSGVAAAMAFAPLTIGSETSGSIISPAAAHGVVGLKPTRGLVSRTGIIPLAPTYDTAGPMTRTVLDAAAVLDAISVADPADAVTGERPDGVGPGTYLPALADRSLAGVRVGVREGDLGGDGLFASALATMEGLGATIVPVADDELLLANGAAANLAAIFNDFKMSLNAYLASVDPPTGVGSLADVIAFNRTRPEEVQYGQTLLQLSDAQSGLAIDPVFLAASTTSVTTSRAALDMAFAAGDLDVLVGPGSANTLVTAAAGYPNLTVPMGYDGAIPQGLAIAGLRWEDAVVLRVGHAFQVADDRRVPPTAINPALAEGVCEGGRPVRR